MTIEEAIKEIKDASYSEARYGDKDNHRDKVMKRIEAFDMAIQVLVQTKWIPVSERLPEDNIHVLCQFYLGGMGECYLAHGVFHVVGGVVMTCNEVIAWMPLPQPYNVESEDKG